MSPSSSITFWKLRYSEMKAEVDRLKDMLDNIK